MNEFPYKKKFASETSIKNKIKNMKNFIPAYSKNIYKPLAIIKKTNIIDNKYHIDERDTEGKYIKIITSDDAYENVNILSDYFNEESRMKCSFNYYLSPLEYYILNKQKINLLTNTEYEAREYIFSKIKECNTFKITTAMFVYDFFKATHILDFSSGWGDRLMAACGLGLNYMGIDPNLENHTGYNRIIDEAGKNPKQVVYKSGAEYLPERIIQERISKYGEFDLIFTSPPYFDYETYSDKLQSAKSFSESSDSWIVFFLFVVLIKYIPYLKIGGHIGIYIQDIKNRLIVCEPLVLFFNSFYPNFFFNGIISEKFPMLIFSKVSNKIDYVPKNYDEIFKKNYPKVYSISHILIKKELYRYYSIETKIHQNIIDDFVENSILFRTLFKFILQKKSIEVISFCDGRNSVMIYWISRAAYVMGKKCILYCPSEQNDYSKLNDKSDWNKMIFSSYIDDSVKKHNLIIKEIPVDRDRKQIEYIHSLINPDPNEFVLRLSENCEINPIFIETLRETFLVLDIDTNSKINICHQSPYSYITKILKEIFHMGNIISSDGCNFVLKTPF